MKPARTFLLLAFLGTALLFPAALSAQRVERTFPASPDTTIEIRNLHGQVTVHGWDRPQVKVIATPRTNAVEAHFEQPASRVHIHTHVLQSSVPIRDHMVDYEVWAPSNNSIEVVLKTGSLIMEDFSKDVNISTVTATVELRNISGHTSVETLNGSIRASQCGGRLETASISGTLRFTQCAAQFLSARTTSGDIYYTGSLKFGGTYEFHNHEGIIELLLPSDASFELSANAVQGQVANEFPLKARSHGRLPKRGQRSLLGTSQSGAALVRVTSFSGTIRIRKQ